MKKQEILDYARANKLEWHEDETNQDEKYLRNFIRKKLANKEDSEKQKLLALIRNTKELNTEIDELVAKILENNTDREAMDRRLFAALSYDISCEVLASWLRQNGAEMNSTRIHQLVQKLKTSKKGSEFDVDKRLVFAIDRDQIRLKQR